MIYNFIRPFIIPVLLIVPSLLLAQGEARMGCQGTEFEVKHYRDGELIGEWAAGPVTTFTIEDPIITQPTDEITVYYYQYGHGSGGCVGPYHLEFNGESVGSNIPHGTLPSISYNLQGSYQLTAMNYWYGYLNYTVVHEASVGIEGQQAEDTPIITVHGSTLKPLISDGLITELKIFDVTGKIVHQLHSPFIGSIDLQDVPSGLYVATGMWKEQSFRQRFFLP